LRNGYRNEYKKTNKNLDGCENLDCCMSTEGKLEKLLQEQLLQNEYKKTDKNLDACENLDCCMLAYLKKLLDVYKTYQYPKKTGEKKKMFPLPFLGGDTAEKKDTTLQKAIQILGKKRKAKKKSNIFSLRD